MEADPSLLESPHRPRRSADELVGEAARFREPIPEGTRLLRRDGPPVRRTRNVHRGLASGEANEKQETGNRKRKTGKWVGPWH